MTDLRCTQELFERRIPKRPFATDDLGPGLYRMNPHEAMQRANLQVNPPSIRFWMPMDVDRPNAALAWDDAELPEPAWVAQNPANGHAHIVYGIEAPVRLDNPECQKPVRYLWAIESGVRAKLDADPSYGGFMTKNPYHDNWRTYWGKAGIYGLDDLAEYVDLDRHKPHRGVNVDDVGLGRNCTLFEHVRFHAYRNVRHYRGNPKGLDYFERDVHGEAMVRNGDFPIPLPSAEVWQVAKSIAVWTWRKFDVEASDRRFSDRQARRGTRKGQTKREQMMPTVLEMIGKGMSQNQVANQLGVNKATVSRWIRGVAKP